MRTSKKKTKEKKSADRRFSFHIEGGFLRDSEKLSKEEARLVSSTLDINISVKNGIVIPSLFITSTKCIDSSPESNPANSLAERQRA